jgi:hypothetical protein
MRVMVDFANAAFVLAVSMQCGDYSQSNGQEDTLNLQSEAIRWLVRLSCIVTQLTLERLSKVVYLAQGQSELQLPANFGKKSTIIGQRSLYIALNQFKSLLIPRRRYYIRKST